MVRASKSQLALIHSLVTTVANFTGHEAGEVKIMAKSRALRRGYPFDIADDGQVEPASTTEISSEHAGHLIEELYQLAAEVGALYQER